MDSVSPQARSRMMAAVRGRDTTPEMVVRSMLHRLGLRFRLHDRSLPGTPDIVLAKHATVVLVHGCFWHGHACARGKAPSSRVEFWNTKLQKNRARDRRQVRALRSLGWRVLTVWECETIKKDRLVSRLAMAFGSENITADRRSLRSRKSEAHL